MKVRLQNRTVTGGVPLDLPTVARPHRIYVAVTNHCNRACPWCSTCSSPSGSSFITTEALRASWPPEGPFELQLEGGEPTVHPELWDLVAAARAEARCVKLVVVTNGLRLPRDRERLARWLERLGSLAVIKLSINHYLLERDPGLLALAALLRELMQDALILNVRLRRDVADDDAAVTKAVTQAGLHDLCNVFYLQRYGYASEEQGWELPFVVGTDFTLVNPDGALQGIDLVARSEAMRVLP